MNTTRVTRPEQDYRACAEYLRRCGPVVYAMPRMLLPPNRRPYCDAIQAFTIHADRLIDDPRVPAAERGARLDAHTRAVLALLDGETDPWEGPPESSVDAVGRRLARAFVHFTRVWDVPPDSVRQALETVAGDAQVTEYSTFADLERYIRGSGAPYILWVNALLGRRAHASREARERAVATIFGVELMDNLSDLPEDLAAGRLGLPVEDLRAFGLERADLERAVRERATVGALRDLVRFEADRARRYLEEARDWWRFADPAARELPRQYVRLSRCALEYRVGSRHDVFARSPGSRLGWVAAGCAGFAGGYARSVARRMVRRPDRPARQW